MPSAVTASQGANVLIAGRADAAVLLQNGCKVVFDWKSDVAPKKPKERLVDGNSASIFI
jgi:hypothetical protein